MARTTEQVRKEIDAERERLATALDDLRGSIGSTAKRTLPLVAGATTLLGVARHFARRGRRR